MKRILCLIPVVLGYPLILNAAVRIGGDITDDLEFESFSFPIGAVARAQNGQTFIGARDTIADPNAMPFAVSVLDSGGTSFTQLAPETVQLNGTDDTPNPLHGSSIIRLASLQGMPLAVPASSPNTVVLVANANAVLQTDVLQDGNGDDAASIIGLQAMNTSYAAAVEPNSGAFGSDGSGIAFGKFLHDDNNQPQLAQMPNEFLSITTATPQLTRNNQPLAQIQNDADQPVVFTIFPRGKLSYIGFSVTSGSDSDAGARSIIVGKNVPIIPEDALTEDAIIGTNQPDTKVWVHNIATAVTSTQLPYMILNGGVGDVDATRRQIFALPLVNDAQSSAFGTIAARGSEPEPQFSNNETHSFVKHALSTPASSQQTMWRPYDPDVRVGGDRELPGAVTDLWAEKDAVFVAVPEIYTDATLPSGVYYSQALFNEHGRIIGWTDWAPTANTANTAVERVIYEQDLGQYLCITQDDDDPVRVSRTQVERAEESYATIASPLDQVGGIQGLVDIPYIHPALSTDVGHRMAVTIATGFQTVVIAQTARDEPRVLIPRNDITLSRSENGRVTAGPTDGFIITGDDINELGAIITADIGTDGNDGWLVVGGSDGVAVLQADDGAGWPADGLQADFVNMPELKFVRIPGITQVRSVAVSEANIFVLTNDELYRIPLNRRNLAQASPTVYTIARADELCAEDATFSDIVISGSRAILATSCGLFTTAPTQDVNTHVTPSQANWQFVDLPESVGPITRLYPISPTGLQHDIATTPRGGAIYAINAAVSTFQTQIYRLAVTPESGVGRSRRDTLRLYPDYFTDRTRSYFVSRGDYRNYTFFDGASLLLTRSHYIPYQKGQLFVELLPANTRSGIPFIAEQSKRFFDLTRSARIEQPLRSSATGALLMYGSFGVYVQQ